MIKHLTLSTITFLTVILIYSCNKNKPSCYDRSLERKAKGSPCLADCPGVTGCDGKFYCNECEANRNGIKIK